MLFSLTFKYSGISAPPPTPLPSLSSLCLCTPSTSSQLPAGCPHSRTCLRYVTHHLTVPLASSPVWWTLGYLCLCAFSVDPQVCYNWCPVKIRFLFIYVPLARFHPNCKSNTTSSIKPSSFLLPVTSIPLFKLGINTSELLSTLYVYI